MLFKHFAPTFLDTCLARKNSAGEMKQKQMTLTNHLLPFFGDTDLEAIGKPEIRAFIKRQSHNALADKTINNHLIVLSRFLTLAREERVLAAPFFKVELIAAEWTEAPFLSTAQCHALISSAASDRNAFAHALIIVALNTGMRIGELLALDWADVSLHARKITVAKSLCRVSGKLKAPKNGKRRDISLNALAQAALKSLPTRQGRVFALTYSAAHDAIHRCRTRCNLPDIGWHTLRHTFASMLVMQGVPLFSVSRLLGHRSVQMTERYAHLQTQSNKDAVACLAAALEA